MTSRGLSEDELAQKLKSQSDRAVNAGLIHAWRAESKHRWHLPADLVPLICEILGDDTIQRLLLSEKLRQSLELGESTPRIVALLQSALPEATERKTVEGRKKSQRRSKR